MTTQIVHEAEYSRQHARFRIPAKLIVGGNPYEIEEWSVSGLSAIKIPQEIGAKKHPGESLFLRKFVLGIQAQANSKKLHATVYACGAPTVLRTLRNHLFAALHNSLSDSTPT